MLTKNVNGVTVAMSAEEEAAIRAEWAANAAKVPEAPKPTLADLLVSKGILTAEEVAAVIETSK